MRIIAGDWGGRTIAAPKGRSTRPTTDRVREALMSTLASARGGFDGAIVFDPFAGSGALGLEALSRGADEAWFFEKDRSAFACLKGNIESLNAEMYATARQADAFSTLPSPSKPFDLILLDPPYSYEAPRVFAFLDVLADSALIDSHAIVSYEHDAADEVRDAALGSALVWEPRAHKIFGDLCFDVFVRR